MRVVPVPDAAVGQPAVDLVLTDGSVDDDVRTFLMFLSARDFSPNTIRAYAYDLLKLMTFLESRGWSVQDFTPARAVEFLQWLRQQTSRRRGQRYEVAAVTASGGVPLSGTSCTAGTWPAQSFPPSNRRPRLWRLCCR